MHNRFQRSRSHDLKWPGDTRRYLTLPSVVAGSVGTFRECCRVEKMGERSRDVKIPVAVVRWENCGHIDGTLAVYALVLAKCFQLV